MEGQFPCRQRLGPTASAPFGRSTPGLLARRSLAPGVLRSSPGPAGALATVALLAGIQEIAPGWGVEGTVLRMRAQLPYGPSEHTNQNLRRVPLVGRRRLRGGGGRCHRLQLLAGQPALRQDA